MLFRCFETYLLTNVQPRVMPHFKTYIETLNTKRELLTERNINAPGYESNIIVLLRKILADADIPALLRKTSDLDRYLDILIFTTPSLNNIFDAVTTGLTFSDMAIRRTTPRTEEFFIPVSCQDPLALLPFDRGWDYWQKVKPLRLVDIDSSELTFATYQDQIYFSNKTPPTRAVMTIDVVALILQYLAYLQGNSDSDIIQAEYLHQHVMVHLLQDLEDLWLGNMYCALLKQPTLFTENPKQCINKLMGDARYGFQGTELPIALRELSTLIASCKSRVITPAVLLQSLLLSTGNIPDFLVTLLITTTIDDRRQNYWMEAFRDARWLNLLYYAYQLQPDFVATKNLYRNLRRDLPILCAMRPWSNCRSLKTSQVVQNILQELLHRVS